MIGLVAVLRINEGKAEVFEDIFREITALVRAAEPGCLLYQLTRSRTDPNGYKVLELYADQAALTAHGDHAVLRELFVRMRDCLADRPEIEYLDAVI